MRSAKLTGMLFSPKELPTPSWGAPSMNTLMCLPLKPSIVTAISEPTPPFSLIFRPGAFCSASPSVLVVFDKFCVLIVTALYAEFLILFTGFPTTVTSASLDTEVSLTLSLDSCPGTISVRCSCFSNPTEENTTVYFPGGTCSRYAPRSSVMHEDGVPLR